MRWCVPLPRARSSASTSPSDKAPGRVRTGARWTRRSAGILPIGCAWPPWIWRCIRERRPELTLSCFPMRHRPVWCAARCTAAEPIRSGFTLPGCCILWRAMRFMAARWRLASPGRRCMPIDSASRTRSLNKPCHFAPPCLMIFHRRSLPWGSSTIMTCIDLLLP